MMHKKAAPGKKSVKRPQNKKLKPGKAKSVIGKKKGKMGY